VTRRGVTRAWLLGVVLVAACHHQPDPIRVEGRTLVVENQTARAWRNVTVTVNSYYRAGAPALAAGGRLEAGLSTLTTGFGQRFNPVREAVHTVEVRATDDAGNPVSLDYSDKNSDRK
jgi:hypothetical protein